jgi:hypothetical protein
MQEKKQIPRGNDRKAKAKAEAKAKPKAKQIPAG